MSAKAPVPIRRWMRKPVSLLEASVQERLICELVIPANVAVRPVGRAGTAVGTVTEVERMKSFSSCARMWQCHTYS